MRETNSYGAFIGAFGSFLFSLLLNYNSIDTFFRKGTIDFGFLVTAALLIITIVTAYDALTNRD